MVRNLGEELFQSRSIVDENNDDTTRSNFIDKANLQIGILSSFQDTRNNHYPQADELDEAIKLLRKITEVRDTKTFFDLLKAKEDELLDWAEDSEDIMNFHKSNQKLSGIKPETMLVVLRIVKFKILQLNWIQLFLV